MPESPLVGFKLETADPVAEGAEVVLGERPFPGHLNLRGRSDDATFVRAAEQVLGLTLPVEANTTAGNNDHRVLWLGPDEWLVVTPRGAQASLQESLEKSLQDCFASITDVSSGNTVIAVSGPRSRELLAKGTSLDIHPRAFPVGGCAQTHFAHAGALICLWDSQPTFELVVRRSFADYVWRWLHAAARDMALGVQATVGVSVRQ